MLKLSRYIVISALFLLTLVIFLTFNPDSYDVEPADGGAAPISRAVSAAAPSGCEIAVVRDGAADGAVTRNISRTLSLLKRAHKVVGSVPEAGPVQTIIMAAASVTADDVQRLKAYLAGGGSVIFAVLPGMTEEVMDLLGIEEYAPYHRVEGFDIYEGVLLGGMFRAEALSFYCAGVRLAGRCKVFANGHSPYRDKAAEVISEGDENPIIWRTYHEGGAIFALNAPFMADPTGMGVLTGMLALSREDFLYPVVGTKSVILDQFPYIGEGTAAGRTYFAFTRDIVWAGMISVARSAGVTLTCYTNGEFAKDWEAYAAIDYMNKELMKIGGELGYSVNDPDAFETDMAFLRERFPAYELKSLKARHGSVPEQNGATSVLTSNPDDAFEWLNDRSVALPLISAGIGDEHTDFEIASAVSALGLAIHGVDMEPLFTDEVSWNEYSTELSKHFARTLKGLDYLHAVPVAGAAEAVKDYLNAAVDIENREWSVCVSLTGNAGEISFLLRTDKAVDVGRCENCAVAEIEDGTYLISSSGPSFTVQYKPDAEARP